MTVQTNLFQLLQEESLSNNAELQYKIADIYFSGTKDTERDYNKAFKWLTKAAQNNHAISQFALAIIIANVMKQSIITGYTLHCNQQINYKEFLRIILCISAKVSNTRRTRTGTIGLEAFFSQFNPVQVRHGH